MRKTLLADNERLPFVFHALGDQGRFRIFKLLTRQKNICVSDVAEILGISVPAASQQLRVLELSGVVRRERMGQMICYTIRKEDPVVKSLVKLL